VERGAVTVRAGKSGEVVLPDEIHQELGIRQEGGFYLVLREDGVIELVPEVDTDQRSDEWHERQRRGLAEIAAGEGTVHKDAAAMEAHLDRIAGD